MTVSLWIRETVGGKRTYRKPNKKKFYMALSFACAIPSMESDGGRPST